VKKTVYVETSVFSFYYDQRSAPDVIAMNNWTREWWDYKRYEYDIVTSTAVLAELDTGTMPHRQKAFEMAEKLPAIPIESGTEDIVRAYIQHKLMPNDPLGDPLHLANANKFGHIHRINDLLNLHTPILTTPLELMGEE